MERIQVFYDGVPYVSQLDASKWIKGTSRPVAYLRATPRELCLSHGIEFDYDAGGWGLGDLEVALLQTRTANPFGLIRYLQAPDRNYTAILVDENLQDVTDVVNEILCDLEFGSSDVLLFDLERYHFLPCKLIRQDDHGNRVKISDFDCYPDAFLKKEELERRGHKQTYFIEADGPREKGWTGNWRSAFQV